jgi:hypothetical protein
MTLLRRFYDSTVGTGARDRDTWILDVRDLDILRERMEWRAGRANCGDDGVSLHRRHRRIRRQRSRGRRARR